MWSIRSSLGPVRLRWCFIAALGLTLLLAPPLHPTVGATQEPSPDGPVANKLWAFLAKFAPSVPGLEIQVQRPDGGVGPQGFSLVRYRISSSEPRLDKTSELLLSDDGKTVFIGHALPLASDAIGSGPPSLQARLSDYFTRRAGRPMKVSLDSKTGPGGAVEARVSIESPFGSVESCGALSKDRKWFLFGAFFPLDEDPRKVRVERLALSGRISLGETSAKVTVVEITDFQCPKCAELQPILEALVSRYSPRVKLVRVDLPEWRVHDWGVKAAVLCRCAGQIDPGAFWPLTKSIFAKQGTITADNLEVALFPDLQALGVSGPAFEQCRNDASATKAVLKDLLRVSSAGLEGTPTVLVNGALLQDDIEGLVEKAILKALKEEYPRSSSDREARSKGR
jgi:protein-disulfide isomerase